MKHKIMAAILVLAGCATSAEAAQLDPVGSWRMTNGKLTVKVDYCGQPNLCATITGMRHPFTKEGKPKVDKENPNPSLRNRPIIGLEIMSGMKPDGNNRWKGKIYNADDGNNYDATARFDNDELLVKGCWTFFCKKLHFKRLPEPASAAAGSAPKTVAQ